MLLRILAVALVLIPALYSQRKVDLRNTHHRLLCVVPVVGKGTPDDPRRPEFAPVRGGGGPLASGIIAFHFLPSDDGRFALVEFVARDRAALQGILSDRRPEVKIFEKGKARRADIEREFRRLRKDFDLDSFAVMVP